jgi:hypothetical protein
MVLTFHKFQDIGIIKHEFKNKEKVQRLNGNGRKLKI